MRFCTTCGTKNDDTATFCGGCGASLEQPAKQQPSQDYQPASSGYQPAPQEYQQGPPAYQQGPPAYQQGYMPDELPPRTGWLTFVIVMGWIGVILLGLGGLIFLVIFPPIGLVILVIAGLFYWLVRELSKYNNTARIVNLVLSVLGVLGALAPFNLVSLIISGLTIYALGFHQETIALFKPENQFRQNQMTPKY